MKHSPFAALTNCDVIGVRRSTLTRFAPKHTEDNMRKTVLARALRRKPRRTRFVGDAGAAATFGSEVDHRHGATYLSGSCKLPLALKAFLIGNSL
jgi:hypothetical protein